MAVSPFKLLICDLDGTLVDSEPIGTRVLAAALNRIGASTTFEESERLFTGLSLPQCYELAEARWNLRIPAGFDADLQRETFAALRRELRPMPGVADALERIDLPKCVASSGEPAKIALELDLTGLRGFFGDALFSARQVARAKPAPDVFLFAAERMGARPQDCAVVEDSAPGLAAALAAGMTVFGYRASPAPGVTPLAEWRDLPGQLAR